MADIEIGAESESPGSWTYDVTVYQHGREQRMRVSLSWSDYDLWCKGRVAPQQVVRAVLEVLIQRLEAPGLPARFDCSQLRRHFPDADKQVPGHIR